MKKLSSQRMQFFLYVLFFQFGICSIVNAQNNHSGNRNAINEGYREKIYVHTDKSYYSAGGVIWFKVYLLEGSTNKPETVSRVVYVNLINPDGEIISKKCLKITNGGGAGDFILPVDLRKGKYTLRAYTNFMQNFNEDWFFQKAIFVNAVRQELSDTLQFSIEIADLNQASTASAVSKPELQFFPEGGDLVDGILNRVGFKALGVDGKGIDISGSIYDANNAKVIDFSTLKFGMGSFNFVPEQGNYYKAKLTINDTEYDYVLPNSKKHGVILRVLEEDSCLNAIVRSTLSNGVDGYKLLASQQGLIINTTIIESNNQGFKLKFPKSSLNEGIIQFTLFNQQDHPVCERLFFYEKETQITLVNVVGAKNIYSEREQVKFELEPMESALLSQWTNLSLSVTNTSAYHKGHTGDIRTYLLLNSEINGNIEQPGFYFYSDHPKRKEMLDQLMMTQGWRRYIWEKQDNEKEKEFIYAPETALSIKGNVSRLYNRKKRAEAKLQLSCSNSDGFIMYETEADKSGNFSFDGLSFVDSSLIVVQAKKTDALNAKMNYHIEIDTLLSPPFSMESEISSYNSQIFDESFPESVLSEQEIDSLLRLQKGDIWLEEIVVKAHKIERKAKKRTLYFEPNYTVDFSESKTIANNLSVLAAIQGRYPGSNISGVSLTQYDPGNDYEPGQPLYLLDGIPVRKSTLITLPIDQVDFVDIIKGPKALMLGYAGGDRPTAIAVYTLNARDLLEFDKDKERKGIVNFIHPGFYKGREFYSPVYTSLAEDETPDKRTTLYWNPDVNISGNEKVKFSFYTSDLAGVYKVKLEGITSNGDIVVVEEVIEVE